MLTFVCVSTPEEIAQTSRISGIIQREHFTPITGAAQVDYMLEKFQSPQAMAQQIASGYLYHQVLEDEKLVGFFAVEPEKDKLFLSKFYLEKSCRGKGYGRQMLCQVEAIAKEKGLKAIYLTCNKGNESSILAYEKMGFVIIDSVKNDIGGGFFMDDYVMEKNI